MEKVKKTDKRRSVAFAALALALSVLVLPEKVALSIAVHNPYPQAAQEQNLKPEALAMVPPVPLRKPDPQGGLNPDIFKGLTEQFASLFGPQNQQQVTQAIAKPAALKIDVSMAQRGEVTNGLTYKSKKIRTPSQKDQIAALNDAVKSRIKSGDAVSALKYFRTSPVRRSLDVVEHDKIQASIAAAFLYSGRISSAGKLAAQSAERSGRYAPLAGWIAGLSSWQQKDYTNAAKYFELTGSSPYASSWMASAGSFWASRAYEQAGNNRAMMISLQDAARYPRTFYGLIAIHALGQKADFNWDAPVFDAQREAILRAMPAGSRAMDLVAQKNFVMAEKELLSICETNDKDLRDALLAYAAQVGLPKLSLRLGTKMLNADGRYYDAALYPVTPWQPADGYTVDSALVHAVMRQESKFDVGAMSQSGAVGLMQILPTTAHYVARNNAYQMTDLKSPKMNLKVGQDYLEYLLKDKNVAGDVLSLLVAYNAGPGNLAKWKAAQKGNDDALLFIEMIPVNETREYVEHVMTNFWMYRLRDGKDVTTLWAISHGKPAQYSQTLAEGAFRMAYAR